VSGSLYRGWLNLQYPLFVFRAQNELNGLGGVKIENQKKGKKKKGIISCDIGNKNNT
jgi:hypothetical protein